MKRNKVKKKGKMITHNTAIDEIDKKRLRETLENLKSIRNSRNINIPVTMSESIFKKSLDSVIDFEPKKEQKD